MASQIGFGFHIDSTETRATWPHGNPRPDNHIIISNMLMGKLQNGLIVGENTPVMHFLFDPNKICKENELSLPFLITNDLSTFSITYADAISSIKIIIYNPKSLHFTATSSQAEIS